MTTVPADTATPPVQQEALMRACLALWSATLSLMTAYMHQAAPAHRYLLARRIAHNMSLLQQQDCFPSDTRGTFARLAGRWAQRAEQLHPAHETPSRGLRQWLPAFLTGR